jgi:hypothetical protein
MLRALQILVGLTALSILVQSVTMGLYLRGDEGMLDAHVAGAMTAATLTLLQAVLAIVFAWRRDGPWPVALAAFAMLVAVAVEMGAGFAHQTALHLPLGLLLFGGAAWLSVRVRDISSPAPADRPARADEARV